MIKFFRRIRQNMLAENKVSKYMLYALGEIILVVIGILIALSISDWNDERKNAIQEQFILNQLRSDISSDIAVITERIGQIEVNISNFTFALDILARKEEAPKEEFILRIGQILSVTTFNQHTTTFENLISSGKIELIRNPALLDSVVTYYNQNYKGWDTAMLDYTRNIIAPYLMNYDHIPFMNRSTGLNNNPEFSFYEADITQFDVKPKSLDDYRSNVFLINMLRQKIFNSEGQKALYTDLLSDMNQLVSQIDAELE